MSLRVTCPGCSKRFQAPDSAAGKVGKCPTCGVTFALPAANSGADLNLGADRPFDDADFDEPVSTSPLSDLPPDPMPLSQMYAPPKASASTRDDRPRRGDDSPTRGRYRRIAAAAVFMDWLQWGSSLVFIVLLIGYSIDQQSGKDQAAWLEGQLALQLALSLSMGSMLFTWMATALLALLDIEKHLAAAGRTR